MHVERILVNGIICSEEIYHQSSAISSISVKFIFGLNLNQI